MYADVQDYRNLSDTSSLPKSEIELTDEILNNLVSNQKLAIFSTPFEPKLPVLSNEVEYLEELNQRPVDPHYNSEKGYKFDVATKDAEKHKIENIRLGDPDVLPNPLLTLLR